MKIKMLMFALLFPIVTLAQESRGKGVVDFRYENGFYKLKLNKLGLSYGYGYQFGRFFYLGARVGIVSPLDGERIFIPLFADGRVYLMKGSISPFLSVRGGYDFLKNLLIIFLRKNGLKGIRTELLSNLRWESV